MLGVCHQRGFTGLELLLALVWKVPCVVRANGEDVLHTLRVMHPPVSP